MTCGRKLFRRGIIEALAECRDCDWQTTSRNALGVGAQHHDRTGHEVSITVTWHVTYALPEVIHRIEAALARPQQVASGEAKRMIEAALK